MEIIEEKLELYEPGKLYIYKSIATTNDSFRDTRILRLESYNYKGKDNKIPALLYINNCDPYGPGDILSVGMLWDQYIATVGDFKKDYEKNRRTNNNIRYNTNYPVCTESIKFFVDKIQEDNIQVVGIYISRFKTIEPLISNYGMSFSYMYRENSVINIKNKLKQLAEELNIPVVTTFKFKTDCKHLSNEGILML